MKVTILYLLSFIAVSVATLTVAKNNNAEIKDLIAPPPQIEHYSAGMAYQFSDLLWIRAIQDFDYCESLARKNVCKGNSWLFKMLDAITNLDQKYYIAYSAGGLALTVLISDFEGASKIFDKGVVEFPDDWRLLYRAAYHVLYEEANYAKAAVLFEQAGKNGAPDWTIRLANRLNTKEGQVEVGERLIEDLIRRHEDENIIARLKEKIEQIKSQPEASSTAPAAEKAGK